MSDILKINQKIAVTETKLKFLKKKMALKKEYKKKIQGDARRERAHKLITKGALLEILSLENEDNEVLLGFFSTFSKERREEYKEKGKEIFKKRKEKSLLNKKGED